MLRSSNGSSASCPAAVFGPRVKSLPLLVVSHLLYLSLCGGGSSSSSTGSLLLQAASAVKLAAAGERRRSKPPGPPRRVDHPLPANFVEVTKGSVSHPVSCNDPCKFARRGRGCKDGVECDRCHVCTWTREAEAERRRNRLGTRRGRTNETTGNSCPPPPPPHPAARHDDGQQRLLRSGSSAPAAAPSSRQWRAAAAAPSCAPTVTGQPQFPPGSWSSPTTNFAAGAAPSCRRPSHGSTSSFDTNTWQEQQDLPASPAPPSPGPPSPGHQQGQLYTVQWVACPVIGLVTEEQAWTNGLLPAAGPSSPFQQSQGNFENASDLNNSPPPGVSSCSGTQMMPEPPANSYGMSPQMSSGSTPPDQRSGTTGSSSDPSTTAASTSTPTFAAFSARDAMYFPGAGDTVASTPSPTFAAFFERASDAKHLTRDK